jgi:hypothetical protein
MTEEKICLNDYLAYRTVVSNDSGYAKLQQSLLSSVSVNKHVYTVNIGTARKERCLVVELAK